MIREVPRPARWHGRNLNQWLRLRCTNGSLRRYEAIPDPLTASDFIQFRDRVPSTNPLPPALTFDGKGIHLSDTATIFKFRPSSFYFDRTSKM